MGAIFGKPAKSKSTQTSSNQAYQPLLAAYQPLLGYANQGAKAYSDFLSGDRTGFDNYLKNTSYDFDRDRGEAGIGTAIRQQGLRNSGAALKRLSQFNTQLNNGYADAYLGKLQALMGIGNAAGSLLAGAGGSSTGTSTSTGPKKGLLDYAGQAASTVASIKKI